MIEKLFKLFSFLDKRKKFQLVLIIILMLLSSIAEMFSIGMVVPFLGAIASPEVILENKYLLSLGLFDHNINPEDILLPFTILFIVITMIAASVRLLLLFVTIRFSHAIGRELGVDIFRKTMYQKYSCFVNENSSDIINGVIVKVNTMTDKVIKPFLLILSSSLIMIGILSTLFYLNPLVAASAFFCFGIIYIFAIKVNHFKLRENSKLVAEHSSRMVKTLQEGLGGFRDVLIENSQEFYCDLYEKSNKKLRKALGDTTFIAASPRFIMEALGISFIAILSLTLRTDNGIDDIIPTLGALALGAQRLLPIMQTLYDSISHIRGSESSLDDILELLDKKLPFYALDKSSTPIEFANDILLDNISFRYSSDTPNVIKNINIKVVKGSKIGFIGATGSGKSTIIDIIMGLIEPSEGFMFVDNVKITESNKHKWWKRVAHVPQDIYLSDNSIKENIAFGQCKDEISISRVTKAAKFAQIDRFINSLDKAYDTRIGEKGIMLSGGQRQRIGIARALYSDADLIIFDEATSALDNDTEMKVMNSINKLDNVTIIMIAHRISTLRSCDFIYSLKNGEIDKVYQDGEIANLI